MMENCARQLHREQKKSHSLHTCLCLPHIRTHAHNHTCIRGSSIINYYRIDRAFRFLHNCRDCTTYSTIHPHSRFGFVDFSQGIVFDSKCYDLFPILPTAPNRSSFVSVSFAPTDNVLAAFRFLSRSGAIFFCVESRRGANTTVGTN